VRGSSPLDEIRQGFVEWVKGLRSIDSPQDEESPGRSTTPRGLRKLDGSVSDSSLPVIVGESPWQDDGGEGS
jgi:hypothetical protein